MTPERQALLTPILDELRTIPGVKDVFQDDFDSQSVNVFLDLECYMAVQRPFKFNSPLRSTKASIKRICKKFDAPMNFLDWPVREYDSDRGEKSFRGYSQSDIKIEVFVPELWEAPKPQKPVEKPINFDAQGRPAVNWGH